MGKGNGNFNLRRWAVMGASVVILGGVGLGLWLKSTHLLGAQGTQGQATDLSAFIVPLDEMKRQFGAKAWATSVSGETHFEKWISDPGLASALSRLGETAFLYNAYYEPDKCLSPFCSVSSTSLYFQTSGGALKAQQLLLAYYEGQLANKRPIDPSDPQGGQCLGGDVDHYYLITCTAVIDRITITVQVAGTTQISPEMEQAAQNLLQGVEATAAKR